MEENEKIIYSLTNEPIDVVIPAVEKDFETLESCIEGIKKNCKNLGRVIVVSNKKMTNNAEWFDEANYPFDKYQIAFYLNQFDLEETQDYLNSPNSRVGWYYQQLLKLYSPFVIPNISSNVLILDSDTVFFRSIDFISSDNKGLYATGTEFHQPYFNHAQKLLPGIKKLYSNNSGICHHMLFQKAILEDLFSKVETLHQLKFWEAFCLCVNPQDINKSGASEYEIYFNFAFSQTNQVKIRQLKWKNSSAIHLIKQDENIDFDYISYHAYLRN
ncbi:MAG: DUF6492 family protein [Parachlamydiaceae bacterium]